MSSQHKATFTWPGNSANTVFVTGAWDNWSGNSHALHKQSDGGFIGHVDLPFGQTYSYKYVVDGEWKTREDEAKEWDAAGNMNNVYTAPSESTHVVKNESTPASAAAVTESKTEPTAAFTPPPSTALDRTVLPTEKSIQPQSLLASSTPGPAASNSAEGSGLGLTKPAGNSLDAFGLGAPIGGGGVSDRSTKAYTPPTFATTSQPIPTQSAGLTSTSTPATATTTTADEKTVTTGESPLQQYAAQAAAIGGGALAALGAGALAVGGVVEKVTGVDVIHHPISVDAAKRAGIDIRSLDQVDAPTHTATGTSPIPASAVDALEEKIQALKVNADKVSPSIPTSDVGASSQKAVPLPQKPEPKTSLPLSGSIPSPPKDESPPKPDLHAQADNAADHKTVPAPVIKNLSARDPAKDRTLSSNDDGKAANQPISTDPSVSAKEVKADAQAPAPPAKNQSQTPPPVVSANLAAKTPIAAPAADAPPTAPAAPVQNPTAVAQARGDPAATALPPATPTKTAATGPALASPGSAMSTPAGTPQKPSPAIGHGREATTNADKVRKRKSSFFSKIKERFSSPSKEK